MVACQELEASSEQEIAFLHLFRYLVNIQYFRLNYISIALSLKTVPTPESIGTQENEAVMISLGSPPLGMHFFFKYSVP